MKNIEYIRDHPIYNEKYWNNTLKNSLVELLNKEIDHYHSHELELKLTELNNEINQRKKEFKENHSTVVMFFLFVGIIFGFIFFVFPGILALRKYIRLNQRKKEYLARIKEKKDEKTQVIGDLIKSINFSLIKDKALSVLKFNTFQPISMEFLEEIDYLNLHNFLVTPKYNSYNPGSTSWTIFNNSIIIKKNNITHEIINKRYEGTQVVSTTVTVNGRTTVNSQVVTSYYYHPCPVFKNYSRYLLYLNACPELELSYSEFNKKKLPRINKNITLENELFNHRYVYKWNDDALVRMLFTPFFMEKYLKVNNEQAPPLEMQINKKTRFLYTNKNIPLIPLNMNQFLKNDLANSNFNDLKQYIIGKMLVYCREQFDQVKYSTLLPVVQSESHLHKVQSIITKQRYNNSIYFKENETFRIHFFLNEYFTNSFELNNKNSIHNVIMVDQINNINNSITCSLIETLTYDVVKKSILQNEFSSILSNYVSVNVDYDDYIEKEYQHNLFYFEIENEELYYMNDGMCHNLPPELIQSINIFKMTNTNLLSIIINKKYVMCLFSTSNFFKQVWYDDFNFVTFQNFSNEFFHLIK